MIYINSELKNQERLCITRSILSTFCCRGMKYAGVVLPVMFLLQTLKRKFVFTLAQLFIHSFMFVPKKYVNVIIYIKNYMSPYVHFHYK